jgi:hypothetical protein
MTFFGLEAMRLHLEGNGVVQGRYIARLTIDKITPKSQPL